MKKLLYKFLATSFVMIMLSTSVFAASSSDVTIYIEEQETKVEYLSISEVTSQDNVIFLTSEGLPVPTYIVNSSSVAKIALDSVDFKVMPIVELNGYWSIDTTNLSGLGDVLYYDEDGIGDLATYDEYMNGELDYEGSPEILKNSNVALSEPGLYYITATTYDNAETAEAVVVVNDSGYNKYRSNSVCATPIDTLVTVDGSDSNLEAYEINGNTYFKLRDLAQALNGTDKEFSITWTNETYSIDLTTGESYSPVGGEFASFGDTVQLAVKSPATILCDGEGPWALTAYEINGNTYIELMDLGFMIDCEVYWDYDTLVGQVITVD